MQSSRLAAAGFIFVLVAGLATAAGPLGDQKATGSGPVGTDVTGSQSWFITDNAACGNSGFRMDRGSGAGVDDIVVRTGRNVTFCANEAALVNTTLVGAFTAQFVFREPHPLINGTQDVSIDLLCPQVPTNDYFTIRLGVFHAVAGLFEPIASVDHVRACELYQLPVAVEGTHLEAELPMFTTGDVSVGSASTEVHVAKGDFLALQLQKAVMPEVQVAANLVTAPGLGSTDGPSMATSPPADPGYPVPELPTIALVGLGGVAGVVALRRR
ncbi:MAG: hypothetical protein LC624_03315 [Halobacteriales archaeon]|nr:hypothetical protein [Halobacteriales archaeon]